MRIRPSLHRPHDLVDLDVISTLSRNEKHVLRKRVRRHTFAEGETLCRQGRTGISLMFILSGTGEVRRNGAHVADVSAGDVVGERSMLMLRVYQDADVIATSDMTVATLSRREFLAAVEEQPTLRITLSRISKQRNERVDAV